jgi:hypothetical protein
MTIFFHFNQLKNNSIYLQDIINLIWYNTNFYKRKKAGDMPAFFFSSINYNIHYRPALLHVQVLISTLVPVL